MCTGSGSGSYSAAAAAAVAAVAACPAEPYEKCPDFHNIKNFGL
jgi:hypothetical protein